MVQIMNQDFSMLDTHLMSDVQDGTIQFSNNSNSKNLFYSVFVFFLSVSELTK